CTGYYDYDGFAYW
nr:immunoglobulin heavy chain junction region [Mus musculus]